MLRSQMRDLEAKQAAEEAQLLQSSSASGQSRVSPASSDPALAPGASRDNRLIPSFNLPPSASAPTTPPRSPSHAGSPDSANSDEARRALDRMARGDGLSKQASDFNHLQWANATAPTSPHDHFGAPGHPQTHRDQSQSNYNRAKSQPVSRRHSRDNLHPEDLGHSEAQGLVEGFDRMNINGNV